MERRSFLIAAVVLIMAWCTAARPEPIPVRHIQRPMQRSMTVRLEDGKTIASGAFTQVVQGEEVTMRLLYHFADGSIDDEMTTYRQQGDFRLVRSHHIQTGPFFPKPVDFAVDASTAMATTRTTDKNGKTHVEREHIDFPNDLANGFVGTLLLNLPPHAQPFRVGMLVPVGGGRLIRLFISPEGEKPFYLEGKARMATVFRIHPELGGIVGILARLIGLQPKDVMVWVLEGADPAVVRIVGQLGGYGPVVSSELMGTSF
jgi:hypothetical protein